MFPHLPSPPARIERIHMHASIMADTQNLQRCKRACKRCDSGICSSCCKCVKPKGRPRKILLDIEPIRVNVTRNARPSLEFLSLEDEIPDYELVEPVIAEVEQFVAVPSDVGSIPPRAGTVGNTLSVSTDDMGNEMSSQANIVRMLKLLGISEKSVFSDVKRFPSVDDRRLTLMQLHFTRSKECSEQ